jgi:hypothetical protein
MSDSVSGSMDSNAAVAEEISATSEESQESSSDASEELDQEVSGEEAKKAEQKIQQQIQSQKKKFKLKVDGREYEEEIDLADEENLKKQLQLAKAAQKRMQEFSQLQKEVTEFVEMLRKNPRAALSDPSIGIDIKDLARQVIQEEIENSQKSPELIEKEKLQKELEKLKGDRERERKELQQREFDRLQQQEFERYDMLMTKTLENSDLPKSPYVIRKMADYMLIGLENNIDLTPEDILPLVRQEVQDDLKSMFQVAPEDVIEQMLGKDVINKLRKKNLAKAKQAPPIPVKAAVKDIGKPVQKAEPVKEEDKQTFKQFFKV